MGSAEMIFIVLALVLFMTIATIVNNLRSDHAENTLESQISNDAISLAQALIDEAWSRRFDEITDGSASYITQPAGLGKDGTENYWAGTFDDIDDYKNIPSKINYGVDELNVAIDVYYVDFDGSGNIIRKNERTLMKKFVVTITHDVFDVNVTLEQVFTFLKALK